MKSIEIAKKMMDALIYDNDFVNRWNPFNEEVHYGEWTEKISKVLEPAIEELGEDFFTEDNIDLLTIGDFDLMQAQIDHNPILEPLNEVLNQYFEYLETIPEKPWIDEENLHKFFYLNNMWPFKKKEKKPKCEHEWKTIKEVLVEHTFDNAIVGHTINFIQECQKCHEVRQRAFKME